MTHCTVTPMSALAAEVEAVEAEDMEVGLDYWLPRWRRIAANRTVMTPCLDRAGNNRIIWHCCDQAEVSHCPIVTIPLPKILDQRHPWWKLKLLSCIPPGNWFFFTQKSLNDDITVKRRGLFNRPRIAETVKLSNSHFIWCHIKQLFLYVYSQATDLSGYSDTQSW